MTPVRSIRAFCINCQGGSQKLPALCTNPDCSLYAYREGRNPARKGIGGKGGIKSNGGDIMPTQVGKIKKIIEVSGNKRIKITVEDI